MTENIENLELLQEMCDACLEVGKRLDLSAHELIVAVAANLGRFRRRRLCRERRGVVGRAEKTCDQRLRRRRQRKTDRVTRGRLGGAWNDD